MRDTRDGEGDPGQIANQPANAGFAEQHGPTVLMIAGAVLIAAAVAAVFTGHQWIAGGMWTTGLIAVAMAAMLSRMEGKFRLFGLSGSLRKANDGNDPAPRAPDGSGSLDGSTDRRGRRRVRPRTN